MSSLSAKRPAAGPGRSCRRGLWLTFLSPFGLEVAAQAGAAWIGLDLQHGDLDFADVAPLLRVSHVPVFARVRSHDGADLGRLADTGVAGVIVPAVETATQAEHLVAAMCLPPRGRRSSGLSRASLVGGTRRPLLLPMVETRAGLQDVDEILATDGVDGVFVGPYDLALSLGHPSVLAAPVVAAVQSVVTSARQREKLCGAFAGHPDLAATLAQVDMLGVDTDAAALRAGLRLLFGDVQTPEDRAS